MNTINRDEQQRTSVKLSFSKQQKLKQIWVLSDTMETNTDSPKTFPRKSTLWTDKIENEWTPVASWQPATLV